MYSQKQQGNGLLSFMLGSVALLIMLVVLVLTLDNGDHNFKKPHPAAKMVEKPATETLTPMGASNSQQHALKQDETETQENLAASEVVKTPVKKPLKLVKETKKEPKPADTMIDPVLGAATEQPETVQPRKSRRNRLQPENTELEIVAAENPAEARRKKRLEEAAARKAAAEEKLALEQSRREEQVKKEVAEARVQPEKKKKTHEPAPVIDGIKAKSVAKKQPETTNKNAQVSIQAGAYHKREMAEAQSAKLAEMGVKTKIVSAQNGKRTIYRVQTDTLKGKNADKTLQKLHENGVKTYTHQQQ
ncbi:SPOR domain-containing protein [Kingella negevensis]|uniref:Cell division protein FtsN n=1 Tax=Kingella negevensis TaxID=1522312 RepID=A0A238HH76_9NEIS|nr:SPOR domain-containing protein [Kingella negevensis]MDK4681065.1 SPOR domain-containing protein [Kingella negevensis]MDK4683267.1 SPOR domain-containing protein [Kingella negevensis]MDK4683935.1 SPOR domain-containing protein [Kingella negevensis]MDK4691601.1 SPOR domain-containing protein [Kingella negevensis]MDK4693248.1 SPOR domain-containing protein [Kingella negevensis]